MWKVTAKGRNDNVRVTIATFKTKGDAIRHRDSLKGNSRFRALKVQPQEPPNG